MQTLDFCVVDKATLEGYCAACGIGQVSGSLLAQAEEAKVNNHQRVVDILKEDNKERELSLQYRLSLFDYLSKSPARCVQICLHRVATIKYLYNYI